MKLAAYESNRLADSLVAHIVMQDGVEWAEIRFPLPIESLAGEPEWVRAGLCSKGKTTLNPDGSVTIDRPKHAGYTVCGACGPLTFDVVTKPNPQADRKPMSVSRARSLLEAYGASAESAIWQSGEFAQGLRRARMVLSASAAEAAAAVLCEAADKARADKAAADKAAADKVALAHSGAKK